MTRLLVTSASGANGDGYGAILGFTQQGVTEGPFSLDPRVVDPRGICLDPAGELVYVNSGDDRVLALDRQGDVVLDSGRIEGLDPGGAKFAPDGRYCVTLRRHGTVMAFRASLDGGGLPLLPDGAVPYPRVFGFSPDGTMYLSSGVAPSGEGENTIAVFDQAGRLRTSHLVDDVELSPLDLVLAPNDNIVVSSESPFGARDAIVSVREYEPTGRLVRVLSPDRAVGFTRPRGLRFGPDDRLYCVGADHVVVFDFLSGTFVGAVAHLQRLNGQAIVLMVRRSFSCPSRPGLGRTVVAQIGHRRRGVAATDGAGGSGRGVGIRWETGAGVAEEQYRWPAPQCRSASSSSLARGTMTRTKAVKPSGFPSQQPYRAPRSSGPGKPLIAR